ncbi:MAG: DNA polymerase III subunit gamma/tau [Chitinispirillaceae bacterium]|nr:DNA polymerase III subunit gamma/tau [Chitinispirillaceae bacterium]
MSYIVFARKWRPTTFDDVIGQSHITDTLKKAIEKNRIAHAYIFSGTRGVGKTTTARILARALNCEKGPTPVPCGSCDSCRGIAAGSSFDVLEIDGASNNSVNDIRELRENVGFSSMGGKYRIYVIDEVHMLTKQAFNALLKTLEEPPPNVIFIFATTEPQKIPATIQSRCQRYDFRRIIPEQIVERLSYICGKENLEAEQGALELIASKADGSMRDALSLLDQACSYCTGMLTVQETRIVLGFVNVETYERIMAAVAGKTAAPVLEAVRQVLYDGYDLDEFVAGLEEYVRGLLFMKVGEGGGNAVGRSLPQAALFTEGDLLRMMEIVSRTGNELTRAAYPRFATELMLLKLVFLDSTVSLERIISMLENGTGGTTPAAGKNSSAVPDRNGLNPGELKKKPDPAVIETQTPAREARVLANLPPKGGAPDYGGEEDFNDRPPSGAGGTFSEQWHKFIDRVMHDRPHIGTFLSLATVAGCTDSSIDLVFDGNFSFQFGEVNKKQHREEITKMLNSFFGRQVAVHMTLEAKLSEKGAASHIRPKAAHAEAMASEIAREPVIGAVLDIFDGEVLK